MSEIGSLELQDSDNVCAEAPGGGFIYMYTVYKAVGPPPPVRVTPARPSAARAPHRVTKLDLFVSPVRENVLSGLANTALF